MTKLRLAVLSGVLGASASCLAKFALSPESPIVARTRVACVQYIVGYSWAGHDACDLISLVPRGLCLLLMVSLNILMVGTFLEGIEESGSVAGTALASAANFGTSALFGFLLFHETINQTWLLGFSLVMAGAVMLSTVQVHQVNVPSNRRDQ